jgi:hypothetical protein
MTLDQLRALRPVWRASEPVTIPEATDIDDDDEATAAADLARIRETLAGYARSAPAALQWLRSHPDAARSALVARLYCPKRKRIAELYCLPEDLPGDFPPVRHPNGYRLLIVPTNRGRLSALAGMANNTRKPGAAWWYITDDDVWDLRCKCCPHTDSGIRAADFLSGDPPTGYSTVLL